MCAHDVSNVLVFETSPSQLAAARGDIVSPLFIQPTGTGSEYKDYRRSHLLKQKGNKGKLKLMRYRFP
nr:MAG TPA: hypothetical protein [Caudoviricetes sp.]